MRDNLIRHERLLLGFKNDTEYNPHNKGMLDFHFPVTSQATDKSMSNDLPNCVILRHP